MKRKQKPSLVTSDLNRDLAIYQGEKDEVHILNETAKLVYRLAVEGRSVEDIEIELRERYSVGDGTNLKADILRFVEEMKRKDLIDG